MGITGGETTVSDDLEAIARARRTQCHQLRILHNIRLRGSTATQSLYLGYGGTGVGGEDGGKSIEELARLSRYESRRGSGGGGTDGYGSGARSEGQVFDQDGRGSRYGSQSGGGGGMGSRYGSQSGGGGSENRRGSQLGQDGDEGGGGYGSQYGEDNRRYGSQSGGGGKNFTNEEEEELARRNESFGNANSRHSSAGVEELSERKVSFGNRSSGVHSSSVFPSRSSDAGAGGMQGRALNSSGGGSGGGGRDAGSYDPSSGRMTRSSIHPLHLKDVISEHSHPAVVPVAHPIEMDESATNLKEELGWLKDLLLLYCVLGLSCLLFYLFFNDGNSSPKGGGVIFQVILRKDKDHHQHQYQVVILRRKTRIFLIFFLIINSLIPLLSGSEREGLSFGDLRFSLAWTLASIYSAWIWMTLFSDVIVTQCTPGLPNLEKAGESTANFWRGCALIFTFTNEIIDSLLIGNWKSFLVGSFGRLFLIFRVWILSIAAVQDEHLQYVDNDGTVDVYKI
ncbi:unnamed protein product [Orchesella dallaii]|uniref:Uncharacterized protein n=1 Tax=Orchesella dallaii TaxID=48710 RepID=A0ABP1RZQ9_9HEXA